MKNIQNIKIGIIGMGYVGLPLAVEFSKYYNVIGFDVDNDRVSELKSGNDSTREVSNDQLKNVDKLELSSSLSDLQICNVFIVTVPTPIDEYKRPNLKPLLSATASVGEVLSEGDVVIFESTVYPGATEDDCVPILEDLSGLKLNKDFYVGYSPERINPGDKEHILTSIVKVTSGSNPYAAEFVDDLYKKIITAGTYRAASIKEAEAAKVIENTQRDLNIALINELAIIFDKMDIDTEGVLKAAGTKWNFLPFKPGLVGGHCIGVDPYYLTYKAESIGYRPEIILSGRRLNDAMSSYVVNKLVKEMSKRRILVGDAKILVMGISFKENCSDIRNSKVVDIVLELRDYGCEVSVYDPWVYSEEVESEYGISTIDNLEENSFDAIVIAVGHDQFKAMGIEHIRKLGRENNIIFDLKYLFNNGEVDLKL
jgi:UDP-N-acetyl-D-galactosamine dehydrogenase|tara:strand:- start:233 stop:1510 length:1278 start_codon:yes stop_codon:yes gene_type:complete